MTVPELIGEVLWRIRFDFYGVDRIREFKRDERALTKAIARWGYECDMRGWDYEPKRIHAEIMDLLTKIRKTGSDIQYLPAYLDGAIKRSIGMKADEMSAEQKRIQSQVKRAVSSVACVPVVVEPKTCEVLGMVFRELAAVRHRKPKGRGPAQMLLAGV